MYTIPTILSMIGGGIDLFGDLFGASQYRQTAETNYQVAVSNAQNAKASATTGIRVGRIQGRIAADAARTNISLSLADAEARERNAERLRAFADTRTAQGREGIRRAQRNFDRLKGQQMSAIAASGVIASGSPLEVMAESARESATALADLWDETSFERAELQDRAAMETFGAAQTRIGAMADRSMLERTRRIDRATTRLAKMSAQSEYRSALFGASIERASGYDAARATTMAGIGQAFAGAGNLYSTFKSNQFLGIGGNAPYASARPVGQSIFKP